MKPELGDDLSISVRPETAEVPAALRPFYEGIYSMTLGHRYEVTFIPDFDFSRPEQLVLPTDFDAIDSAAQARLIALATSRFAVMADDSRAGSQEVCRSIRWDDGMPHGAPLVFYVANDRFREYCDELAELSGRFAGIHDSLSATELQNYRVVVFALERVLPAVT